MVTNEPFVKEYIVSNGGEVLNTDDVEITSRKIQANDFYSQVEKYEKTNYWAQLTSEFLRYV